MGGIHKKCFSAITNITDKKIERERFVCFFAPPRFSLHRKKKRMKDSDFSHQQIHPILHHYSHIARFFFYILTKKETCLKLDEH